MTVDVCTKCGGVYFDHGELAELARKHEEQFAKLEALVEPGEPAMDARRADEGLHCCCCGAVMESYQYAACSGVWLNWCTSCGGIWVDEGELRAIGDHLARGHKHLRTHARRMSPLMGPLPQEHSELGEVAWNSIGVAAGAAVSGIVRGLR